MSNGPTVVLHLDETGHWTLHAAGGPLTLLVVDERVPTDRVYRVQDRVDEAVITEIIGDSEVGHIGDGRYPNLADAIVARGSRPRLVE